MFKQKEEVIVIAILAIITSALLSGYGVYYLLTSHSPKTTRDQLSTTEREKNIAPTASPIQKIVTPDTSNNELQAAQNVLGNFFTYLSSKQYQKAADLYGWGHDDDPGNNLQTWPGVDNAETFKNYCQAVGTCLRIKVLTGTKTSDGEYKFIVQFLTNEGKAYQHPSVVDAGVTTDFNFRVKKINDQFKVINPPLYRP